MERASHWLAWVSVGAIVLFAGLNWSVLTTPAPINFMLARVDAPLGVILLGMIAILVVLFIAATLLSRINSLLESRRLLKEIQRVRELAEQAESSRVENLRQLIATEFHKVNESLARQHDPRQQEPLAKLP
jgi:uncharacterized integral membrane protein